MHFRLILTFKGTENRENFNGKLHLNNIKKSFSASQEKKHISFMKPRQLMLLRKTFDMCVKKYKNHINKICLYKFKFF